MYIQLTPVCWFQNWECAHVARFLALSSIPVAEISGQTLLFKKSHLYIFMIYMKRVQPEIGFQSPHPPNLRDKQMCFFPMSQLVCQYHIMCLGSIAGQRDDKKTYVHFLVPGSIQRDNLGYRNVTSICLSGCQLPHHYLGPPSVTDRP